MRPDPAEGWLPKSLLVGALVPLSRRGDTRSVRASSLASSPALHDFGVIVCRYSNASFQAVPRVKWEEWDAFLRAGGYAVIVGIDVTLQRHLAKLVRQGINLEKSIGEGVTWIRGARLYSALAGKSCERWATILPKPQERDVVVLGRNNAGSAVAFEVGIGPGRVAFFPSFAESQRRSLVPALVESARNAVRQVQTSRRPPDWLLAYSLESEQLLRIEAERIANRVSQLHRAKRILVDDGKDLSKECSRILQEILGPAGFSVVWKEEEGGHDIEISGSSITFVVEVRGTSRSLDVDFARQLMDHVKMFRPETSQVKGLLLGNPFRVDPLPRTGPAFTRSCVETSNANSFCLLTTHQLLGVYDQFMAGRLATDAFVSRLKSTIGAFDPSKSPGV